MSPTPSPVPDVCAAAPSIECSTNPWHVPGGCTPDLCEPYPSSPEPTFNDIANHAHGVLGDLAPANAHWTFDWMSAGLTALVLVAVVTLVLVIRRGRGSTP